MSWFELNDHRAQQDSVAQQRHFRLFGRFEERGRFRAFQLIVYFGWTCKVIQFCVLQSFARGVESFSERKQRFNDTVFELR